MRRQAVFLAVLVSAVGVIPGSSAAAQRTLTPNLPNLPAVYGLAFSPRGESLVAGDAEGGVTLWDAVRPAHHVRLGGHRRAVYAVAFSPDGRTVASGCHDHTVKLWDVADRKEIATLGGYRGRVYSVVFSPDGDFLATGGGVFVSAGEIKLWNAAGYKEATGFQGQEQWVRSVAFTPDGATMAAGGGRLLRFGEVKLWKTGDPENPLALEGLRDEVLSLAFSPDGETLAVAGRDETVRLFTVADGKPGRILRGHTAAVFFVTYANPAVLVSAGDDNTVRFWSASDGRQLGLLYDPTFPMPQRRSGEVFAVAVSGDGRQLAIGSLNGQIKVWETEAIIHRRTPLYPVYWAVPRGYPDSVGPTFPRPR
jgi:WD40 repeat protein